MDMIYVMLKHRKLGIGQQLVNAWEITMKEAGANILITSSQADEPEPQQWHQKNGFKISGELVLHSVQNVPEVFFVKEL